MKIRMNELFFLQTCVLHLLSFDTCHY